MTFAKLYNNENGDQILVVRGTNEAGNPAVNFSFIPDGLGLCSVGPSWKNNSKGWNSAEAYFEKVDEQSAIKIVEDAIQKIHDLKVRDLMN